MVRMRELDGQDVHCTNSMVRIRELDGQDVPTLYKLNGKDASNLQSGCTNLILRMHQIDGQDAQS